MNIEIEVQLTETTKEVYSFTNFDTNFIFNEYRIWEKPKGKRTWNCLKYWSRLSGRDSNIEEPQLTDFIIDEALRKAIRTIKIQTWKEYKRL